MFLIDIRLNKYDKAILENSRTLKAVSACYKNQEMCNKAVDDYTHALQLVPDFYLTQEMCGNVVNNHSSTIQFAPECCKTQKICDKFILINVFLYFFNFVNSRNM